MYNNKKQQIRTRQQLFPQRDQQPNCISLLSSIHRLWAVSFINAAWCSAFLTLILIIFFLLVSLYLACALNVLRQCEVDEAQRLLLVASRSLRFEPSKTLASFRNEVNALINYIFKSDWIIIIYNDYFKR